MSRCGDGSGENRVNSVLLGGTQKKRDWDPEVGGLGGYTAGAEGAPRTSPGRLDSCRVTRGDATKTPRADEAFGVFVVFGLVLLF